jgi:nucleoside-diphosphate-sugar epimerase
MNPAQSPQTGPASHDDDHLPTVVITGISGALGRRLVAAIAQSGTWKVIGLDTAWFPAGVAKPRHFTVHRIDLRSADCTKLFAGAQAVVHLAADDPTKAGDASLTRSTTERVLNAAAAAGVGQLVVMSSATVYGAYADNPVPLTEDAPLKPNPGFHYAAAKAEVELLVERWRPLHPEIKVAVLRPAVTLGHPESRSWLADAVRPGVADRLGHALPAVQYVHVEDVATAVLHAATVGLDGAFNVAAVDWLQSEDAHALMGLGARLPLPEWFAAAVQKLADLRPGLRRPDGALSYSKYPWVMATDRLRSTGWVSLSSSAEAFVANKKPSEAALYFAKHRQEVTLAGVGVLGVLATSALSWLGLRSRRK